MTALPDRRRTRVVALTGAGSGIGRALAACAARGDALAVADRDGAGLADTRAALAAGARVETRVLRSARR